MKSIQVKIPDSLHSDFKSWCALHQVTMSDEIVDHITAVLDSEKPKCATPNAKPEDSK